MEQSQRPTAEQADAPKPVRHFNTSRALKAVKDSATMDFAYLPDLEPENDADVAMRVPIIPDNYSPVRTGAHAHESDETVGKDT